MADAEIAVHDVVQIHPTASDWAGGCFAIVTEVKPWGVQGYVQVPPSTRGDKSSGGRAFIRLAYGNFERVGQAEWILPGD